MEVVYTAAALRTALSAQKGCAFVPTMGNLHEGHLSLVKQARLTGRPVVVSIFVNPLQFAAGEDLERYPRTLDADCALLHGHADIVFAPPNEEMYPVAQGFYVTPPDELANDLCGAFRPGHFRGVATVVLKLFNLVQPSLALFGKKDYQQLVVIQQMAIQFNLPIEILGEETIRSEDGLALSSRNGYLSHEERREAPRLFQTLNHLKAQLEAGNHDFPSLESAGCETLKAAGWKVDYVAIRRPDLSRPAVTDHKFVILAAAYLGKTRLIDNLELGYNLSLS